MTSDQTVSYLSVKIDLEVSLEQCKRLSSQPEVKMNAEAARCKELGNDCMKNGEYLSAVTHYKNGLDIEPDNSILNCNIAQAYLHIKNYPEAEKYAKLAIDHQNDYTKAYFRAAKAALGRHDLHQTMLHICLGVQNCVGVNLEDLFNMARDLSPAFEKGLRRQMDKMKREKEKSKNKAGNNGNSSSKQLGKQNQIKSEKSSNTPADKLTVENKAKDHKDMGKKEKETNADCKNKKEEGNKTARSIKEKDKQDAIKKNKEDEVQQQKLKGEQRKTEVIEYMKEGSIALQKGLSRRAVDYLKKASDLLHTHGPPDALGVDYMDVILVSYALSHALILSDEYKDVVKAVQILEELERDGKHRKFPAIFLLLGRAFMRLNRYERAQEPLERGLSFLDRSPPSHRCSWPGTTDVIDVSDRTILRESLTKELRESKAYHRPDCICCYERCLSVSQHLIPSHNIFFSDPDFIGYVLLICQEHCYLHFHVACWKEYKESLSDYEKISEKDFLGRQCLTPDCKTSFKTNSAVVKVKIIGPDGEEKNSCECAPPAITIPKVLEAVDKSPKKKQNLRKKEMDKVPRRQDKKHKQESKSKPNQQAIEVSSSSKEDQLKTALQKLVVARKKNFGYEGRTNDPRNTRHIPKDAVLGKDEEFVYTFFLEIFKKEGFMPVDKLKVHWEANKEILPTLQPALITFTDLARFLLDSEEFSMVHDTIGLTIDMPKIYSIVRNQLESKEKDLVPAWQPTVATVLESSKTLTFNLGLSNSKTTHENGSSSALPINFTTSDQAHNGGQLQERGNNLSALTASKAQTYSEKTQKTPLFNHIHDKGNSSNSLPTCSALGAQTDYLPIALEAMQEHNKPKAEEKEISSFKTNFNYEAGSNNSAPTLNVMQQHSKPEVPSKSVEVKDVGNEPAPAPLLRTVLSTEATAGIGGQRMVNSSNGPDQSLSNGHVASINENSKSTNNPVARKKCTAWQPRAKLLEWAANTFPGESQVRLWKALTVVREQNGNTLSMLSYEVIRERAAIILKKMGNGM